MYEMTWGNDKNGLSFVNYVERHSHIEIREDKIQTSYSAAGDLRFSNLTTPHQDKPAVGFNYIYTTGFFVKVVDDTFFEDRPYLFGIASRKDDPSTIKCIVPPETLAYDLARSYHYKQPEEKILVVGMRNTHIPSLFENKFETTLYPVFRIEKIII